MGHAALIIDVPNYIMSLVRGGGANLQEYSRNPDLMKPPFEILDLVFNFCAATRIQRKATSLIAGRKIAVEHSLGDVNSPEGLDGLMLFPMLMRRILTSQSRSAQNEQYTIHASQ